MISVTSFYNMGRWTKAHYPFFLEHKRIPVFLDHRYHTLSIENSYNQTYQQRKPVEELQQFIGYLYMKKKRLFEGRLFYED